LIHFYKSFRNNNSPWIMVVRMLELEDINQKLKV